MFPQTTLVYLRPVGAFLVAFALALVVRRLILAWLARRSGPESLPAVVARTFRIPSFLLCIAASLWVSLRFVLLQAEWEIARHTIGAFVILSITLVVATSVVRAVTLYGARQEKPFVVAGLFRTLTYVAVWSLGALALLKYLGIESSITPLLTALGVGGLAVALALQDTLANFFAGIHILVEEPISVGDFIRLSSNEEGIVTDIGWRTTRVLTGQNNTIVIPNTKITSSILVNFSLPDKRIVMDMPVMAGLQADPEQVMRVVIDEASRIHGVLSEPPPQISFDPGVTLTHLQFKLEVASASRIGSGFIKSNIRLAVLRRFRAEGIPLAEVEQVAVTLAAGR